MSISAIMTPLADAVRLKTDQSGQLTIPQMTEGLNAIPNRSQTDITVDGPVVSIPQGNYKSAANVEIPTVPQATPVIRVNESGAISVQANQEAGYVAEGNRITGHQLQLQSGTTITPSKLSQVAVYSGYFTGGSVIVAGDPDLVPEKIAKGANIFGVQGTYNGLEDTLVSRALTSYSNSTVSYIGSYAFASASLKTVSFKNCTTIHDGAFASCPTLTSVSFPACTTIGAEAFYSCTSLSTIYFPKCEVIGSRAFSNCDKLVTASFSRCTSVYNDAFNSADGITAASFPMCVTLRAGAFQDCDKLSTAYFPKADTIPTAAFKYCSSLTNVVISAASKIGAYAFERCSKLATISAPSCTSVDYGAFQFCSTLTSVDLSQCTTVGSSAFLSCSKLTSVNLSVCTRVNQSAFYSCTAITSCDLPACASIGSYAFNNCSMLSNITIPKCSWIGENAFNGCYKLTTMSLPSCEWLGSRAFGYCSKLSSVYLTGSKLCNLTTSQVFIGASITSTKGSIYVPLSLGWDYKTATNWAYFSNRIFSIEGEEIVKTSFKFTIDLEEYTARVNSTWEEWVNSSYNVDGYMIVDGRVVDESGHEMIVTMYGRDAVSPSDSISEGGEYTLYMIPEKIQFTIDGISYNADEQMEWNTWVNSSYNTAGFKVIETDFDTFILTSDESRYIIDATEDPGDSGGWGHYMPMYADDYIRDNTTYFTQPYDPNQW